MKNEKYKITTKDSKHLFRKRAGFTIVEALIAIIILTISIAGPITIASKGMASANFAKDQITAFYLAQEAVEYIRNKRDENNIKSVDWLAGLANCLDGNTCVINAQDNTIVKCINNLCPALKYNDTTGFYSYTSGIDSNFTRKVNMTTVNEKEVAITATLSWRTGFTEKTFTVKEHILNW